MILYSEMWLVKYKLISEEGSRGAALTYFAMTITTVRLSPVWAIVYSAAQKAW